MATRPVELITLQMFLGGENGQQESGFPSSAIVPHGPLNTRQGSIRTPGPMSCMDSRRPAGQDRQTVKIVKKAKPDPITSAHADGSWGTRWENDSRYFFYCAGRGELRSVWPGLECDGMKTLLGSADINTDDNLSRIIVFHAG